MAGNGRKIGILTGGGDCAGLNAVIASIVKSGLKLGYSFVGFEKSWEGVLDPVMYRPLDLDAVRGISHLGGTILRTVNHGRFAGKAGEKGEKNAVPKEILEMAARNLRDLGVEGLIVIGGDGTLAGAAQLMDYGVNIIGVPKSIDNDLSDTDATFGFSTAVSVAVDALDKIHTTASSHERVFLVECMGRHAGWITLHAGLAANANAIILPEFAVDVPDLVAYIRHRQQTRGSSIVAIAEGVDLGQKYLEDHGISPEVRLGGAAQALMHAIENQAPGEFEVRTTVLGHTQRGGMPNAADRLLAKRYGVAAVEAYDEGRFGSMVRLRGNEVSITTIAQASDSLKRVTKDDPYYQTALKLGVYLNS